MKDIVLLAAIHHILNCFNTLPNLRLSCIIMYLFILGFAHIAITMRSSDNRIFQGHVYEYDFVFFWKKRIPT